MTPAPVVAAPASAPASDGRVKAGFLRQHRAAMSAAVPLAILTGLVAAFAQARNAARLDPVVAIRG